MLPDRLEESFPQLVIDLEKLLDEAEISLKEKGFYDLRAVSWLTVN
jgi:hypothetical protein